MNKLFTSDDKFNIHKLTGLYCICNFGFQFFNYFLYNKHYLNIYTITPHILLHLTTFFFHVLQYRPNSSKMSMFIWEELRFHSMIFGWRGSFSILFPKYSYLISFLTMISADIASYKFGTPGVSTVRGDQARVGQRSYIKEIMGAFFSISQFGATIISMGVFQKAPSLILIFSTLPAIQTSAFGMTLIRKNIINKEVWNYVYIAQLLFTYYIWYLEYSNFNVLYISTFIYLCRRYLGLSKYFIWGIMLCMNTVFVFKN